MSVRQDGCVEGDNCFQLLDAIYGPNVQVSVRSPLEVYPPNITI